MNVTFKVGETPRVYVERIDITGNTVTRDKVIRREFRLNEGDAFNALKVKRSQDRIQSLGFFQDKLEIKQTEGSAPDRVVLGVERRGKADRPAVAVGRLFEPRAVRRPARGLARTTSWARARQLDASVNYSRYSKSVELGFTDPYFLDKPILLGGQTLPPRLQQLQLSSATTATRPTRRSAPAAALRTRLPAHRILELRRPLHALVNDKITLDKSTFYTDPDGTGPLPAECDPLKAGRYLCDEIGTRLTSLIGYSTLYDDTDGIHPTRGQRLTSQPGFRRPRRRRANICAPASTRPNIASFGGGWVFSVHAEGGYITRAAEVARARAATRSG